jgi:1-aminocyclopropane-1-carboxylate deaminase
LQRLYHEVAERAGVEWYVKRDDRYGPGGEDLPLQGNKVRKLQGVLKAWFAAGDPTLRIVSFGGAFSNHLIALATAGKRYGIPTVGVVRGEEIANPILDGCRAAGMQLHFVSRAQYRLKQEPHEQARYLQRFGPALLVPEGGSGPLSRAGTRGLLAEVQQQLSPGELDYFQLAAGTGGTAAGIISGQPSAQLSIEVFPVLKGNWMAKEIQQQLRDRLAANNWQTIGGYHWGGYAKRPARLLEFCSQFSRDHHIPLGPIYTGKLFYGVLDRLDKGCYPSGSRLLTYHSGGIF